MPTIDVYLEKLQDASHQGQWDFEAMPAQGDFVQGPSKMHAVEKVVHRPGVNGQAARSAIILSH